MVVIVCFFCLCIGCLEDLYKVKNKNAINDKWLKYCSTDLNMELITYSCDMRFFGYSELFGNVPLFWSYRESVFRVKKY